MASIFSRILGKNLQSSSKKNASTTNTSSSSSSSTAGTSSSSLLPLVSLDLPPWIPPDLNRDHIRLLVFSDSDDVGLELIFDSKTLRLISSYDNENLTNKPSIAVNTRTPLSQVPGSNRTTKPPMGPSSSGATRSRPAITRFTHRGKTYELMKASNDIRNYADYIFGTMPLLFKGTGMKIHTSKQPLQLMLSRVFVVKLPERSDALVNTSITSEPETITINPFYPFGSSPSNRSLSSNVSVASSTISSIDLLGEDLTNQRFGRLYRRWLKCANRSMKKTQKQPGRRFRRCIGVAFIITFQTNELSKYKHFEEFFCTHAPLIENHFQKIMTAAEININERNSIAAALLDKLFSFKDDLYTLYARPRLVSPAWYILTQEHLTMSKRRALAQQLCSIIDLFTTPKYGDFLNCVLSAVLSYQLSWLSTVSPSLAKSKQKVLFKAKADYVNSLQSFLQYSPLWGQLIDLFSAYGNPLYICRTVLVGSDSSLLIRLLYLLSFFIRPSYLTYKIPNTNLSDTNDEQNRTYKKVRLYMDELIANSTQIQDIEPYSPVHSIHWDDDDDDDEQNLEDDIDILSNDTSANNDNHITIPYSESQNSYQLTYTSDDVESQSVDEHDISILLDTLILHIEQMIIDEHQETNQSPVKSNKKVSVTLQSPIKSVVPLIPTKTLMSLSLFEPNHLGHEPIQINNDYHLDLALSLISSVTSSYSSDFILQAIETTNINDIRHAIISQHTYDISENGGVFLNGEKIDISITILINLDDISVNLYSSKHNDIAQRQERTTLIQPLIEHAHLAKQLLPADFALLNMEDSLQEIYFLALAILKYMKANNKSLCSHESVNSFGDSASTTSLKSGDTDEQRSMTTNNTVTELPIHALISSMLSNESSHTTQIDHNSELIQDILRKFQLQRSDYMFLENILRVLEREQKQMIG
ncbi:unnamed protein product [Rotaria sp. Silwood1]|nr:unnamed protein product [Rotaria sp. Silwood1]CAF3623106.1 unnamed protein product [Rotaria sp. Silwood1]CAF3699210.1 unnamed protein product [Rotaria sp. Silwood1]CAF4589596.1 unnamed protein product [Rotaria sp. Silwood1]CAF4640261.1 unnamed protein product [Rotaria sp. Silwood1]